MIWNNPQPIILDKAQKKQAIYWLSFFHIVVITSSNYLVQIPFTLFGLHTTWGAFTFPFIFLTTDLTIRIFGASLARKIIAVVMIPALLISYILSVVFFKSEWQGVVQLAVFNLFVFRIAVASFTGYAVGQLLDITVFNYLRKLKSWWIAPSAAAIFGNFIDTALFFFVAFYKSDDADMASHWIEIAWVDYGFKLLICGLFFLPLYGMLLSYINKTFFNKAQLINGNIS